jgi:hypothetical protein
MACDNPQAMQVSLRLKEVTIWLTAVFYFYYYKFFWTCYCVCVCVCVCVIYIYVCGVFLCLCAWVCVIFWYDLGNGPLPRDAAVPSNSNWSTRCCGCLVRSSFICLNNCVNYSGMCSGNQRNQIPCFLSLHGLEQQVHLCAFFITLFIIIKDFTKWLFFAGLYSAGTFLVIVVVTTHLTSF